MEAPLALYRRYRPETFAEVIGQDHVTAPLRNALSNNRVNHAYLFSGPRGCGKTTSARILARAINCEKGPIAEPCGVCKSCTDLARGGPGSIDVIEIDAASHGGVDDARDLRERAFFAPVESRYKIYIIDEAHMVTTQGFNALLKLVEEPPPHLKFIFATTEPDKVIGTIRSRTHHYPFRLVPPKALADYMASLCESEGVAIEAAALPLVVRAGAGSVRDSLSVLDQLIGGAGPDGVTYELAVALLGFTPDSLLDACVDGFAAHDSKAVFETIEKVIEAGQDPKRFAEDLLRRLRDLVVLSAVPNAIVSGLIEAAEDQGERLQTQSAGIGAAELTRAADIVAAGLLEMRGATAPRLQLELICAKVLLPGADDSTNGIQARLDRMERRLAIGVPSGTPDAVQPTDYAGGPDAATSRAAARAAAAAGPGTTPTGADGGTTAPGAAGSSPAGGASGGGGAAGSAAGGVPGAGGGASGASAGGGPGSAAGGGDAGSGAPAGGGTAGPGAVGGAGAVGEAAAGGSGGAAGGESGGVGGVAAGGVGSGDAARGAAGSGGASAGGVAAGAGSAGTGSGARSGAWGDESAASAPSVPAAPAPTPAPAAPAAASAGSVGLGAVRDMWPQVLEAVKAKRRFAWIMLSQNAQVIAIDDQTLTLGLVNAGARESFARSGSDEILRQAMIDTIGLNRRIEAVVDPSTDPGAGGGGSSRSGGPHDGGSGAPQGGGAGVSHGGGAGGPQGGGASGSYGGGSGGGAGSAGTDSSSWGAGPGGAASGGGGVAGAGGTGAGGTGGAGAGTGGASAGGGPAGAGGPGPSAAGSAGAGLGAGAAGVGGAGTAAAGAGAAGSGGPGVGGPGADGPGVGDAGAGGAGLGGAGAGGSQGSSGQLGGQAVTGRGAAGTSGPAGGPGSGGQWSDGSGAAVAVQDPPPDPEYDDAPPEPDPWDDPTPRSGAGPSARAGTSARPGSTRPGSSGGASAGPGSAGGASAGHGSSGGASAGPGSAGGASAGHGSSGGASAGHGSSGGASAGPGSAGGASAGSGASGGSAVEGDRREQAASKRRAAEAAVAAEQARKAAAAPAAPEVPLTPEEEADAIGEDDMVLEEDSRSHTDLLRETLGAQIITEEPN